MPTQLCYIINRSLSIHEPLNARFPHRMVGYISWQPCILSRFRQKFSNLIFSMRSSIVPNRIVRRSAMVYCQEKKGSRVSYLIRTMAGKFKINTNWTALGIGGFPHKGLLSTNWIIMYNRITPLQSSTLVSHSKPEIRRQHPLHRTLENFGVVRPKLTCWNNKSFSSSVSSRAACGRFPLALLTTKSRLRAERASLDLANSWSWSWSWSGGVVVQVVLSTSVKRCKRAWLEDSTIFFTDVHEKPAQKYVALFGRNFFPRLLFLQLWNSIFAKCSDRKLSFS